METHRITNSLNPRDPVPGQQLSSGVTLSNRYLIQDVVGVGGMGAVYRARDLHFPKLVKLVAVKEMVNQAREPLVRRTIIQNFEREANILATLHHPAIPRIFDYFSQGERSYLVMELIKGKNLEEIVSETGGFLPEQQVLSWAIELCDVLHYLHTHQPEPIIFRDMKPSNVMINQYNHVVMVDFGIAKHFQVGERGTQVGTEGYSPPEQYRGDATPQADIYAMGATLHHLLTKRDPRFEAPFSFGERPIRAVNPSVSIEFETVINTALQYNPDERFKTADAMKQALIAAGQRTGALATAHLPAGSAPVTTSMVDAGAIKPLWTFKCEDEVRGTPTFYKGGLLVGSYDNNLYCLNASNGEFAWKFPTGGGVVSRPVVHDNNKVVFGSEDRSVYALSLRNGSLVWTYYTDGPVRSSPRLAEGHVIIGSDDGYVHAINALTARQAWKVDASGPVRSSPYIYNDLVLVGSENGDFLAIDFRGTVKWRYKAKRAVTSSPVVEDNAVFFTSLDWTLYALDAQAGWVLWRYRMNKPSISSPAAFQQYVITGATDGEVYCVDSNNGKERWRFSTEHQVTGSPVIYKDRVFIGSVDHHFYCLNLQNGQLRWKFRTGGPITGTPVVYDDVVYFGSNDQHIYALLA